MHEDEPEAEDPFVLALIDEALAGQGYEQLLPRETIVRIRDYLYDYLTLHPEAKQLVRQARPDPTQEQSGDVATQHNASSSPESGRTRSA